MHIKDSCMVLPRMSGEKKNDLLQSFHLFMGFVFNVSKNSVEKIGGHSLHPTASRSSFSRIQQGTKPNLAQWFAVSTRCTYRLVTDADGSTLNESGVYGGFSVEHPIRAN